MTARVGRTVVNSILAVEQSEGMGARVRRSIGGAQLRNLDPFLMLDFFSVQSPAGFPAHPHRGFETVTYMLEGAFQHEDFAGHKGRINAGDLQWMCAGKGIIHSEQPANNDMNRGLQLWVNLPGKDKMKDPSYQELLSKEIPVAEPKEGVKVKVISGGNIQGGVFGVDAKVRTHTPILFLDVTMKEPTVLEIPIPSNLNGFVYILSGSATLGNCSTTISEPHHTLVLSPGDSLAVKSLTPNTRFVVIAGEPINETVVQHGPFVMNSREEIMQAFMDFQTKTNGFERGEGWEATIDHE